MKTPRVPGTKPARTSKTHRVKKDEGPLVPFDGTLTGRTYKPVDTYYVGERLEHHAFGRGVVELIPGPHKIQVWFEPRDPEPYSRRTLVHGGTGALSGVKATLLTRRRPGAAARS